MTVKDRALWVGGLGKEWTTTSGVLVNLNPQWVKSIGYHGDVLNHDWHENYDALRAKGDFLPPGKYFIEQFIHLPTFQRIQRLGQCFCLY